MEDEEDDVCLRNADESRLDLFVESTTTANTSAVVMESQNYVVVKASIGGIGGLYKSKSGPAAAAKKAASKRFQKAKNGATSLTLTVRPTGSDREFSYEATRVKLDKPFVSQINGIKVVRKFAIIVKSVRGHTGGRNPSEGVNCTDGRDGQYSMLNTCPQPLTCIYKAGSDYGTCQ